MVKCYLQRVLMACVYGYLYLPILLLVAYSFNEGRYGSRWIGFSWTWYQQLWNNSALLQTLSRSITIALLAAALATGMGTMAAISLYRYPLRCKRSLQALLLVIVMSPDIVMAISLLTFFMFTGISLGFWALLCAHTTLCLPFVVMTVYSSLKGFNSQMFEAARDLGASEWTIIQAIIVPLSLPAIISSWLLSFTLSFDDVVIASFIAGPAYEVLPLKIYSMVKIGLSPEINALTTLMLALSLLLALLSHFFLSSKSRTVKFYPVV